MQNISIILYIMHKEILLQRLKNEHEVVLSDLLEGFSLTELVKLLEELLDKDKDKFLDNKVYFINFLRLVSYISDSIKINNLEKAEKVAFSRIFIKDLFSLLNDLPNNNDV